MDAREPRSSQGGANTASHLLNQQVQDSENKYRTLFSIEKDALFLIDNQTFKILEANDAACSLYGYSMEEILKLRNFELSAEPEKTRQMREDLKERIEHRVHKKKDGSVFPVDISSSIFVLKGRKVLLAAVRDMTNRKKAEDTNLCRIHLLEFADAHTLDELLEETLNQAEWLTGSLIGFYNFVESDQKTVIMQNWSARTKRDYCTSKSRGMSIDLINAGLWGASLRERGPIIHNDFTSLTHKNGFPAGHPALSREIVVPVFRAGKIVALMGLGNKPTEYTQEDLKLVSLLADLAWDITARKRAEEVLHLSEIRFKTIFNESPFGIALIDSLTGHVLSVNPMFAKIAGRRAEELEFIEWMSITHPDDIQKDLENMALLNAGLISGFQMEKRYLLPDGKPVWISMTIAPVNVDDKSHPRHLCMIEDITMRKETAHEIQLKNDALIKINAEKDRFFSIIAHDLRGPFSGFLGLTELLVERLAEMTADEIRQMAFLMRQSATNLYNLLGNLLEWSRMQRGLTSFYPTSWSLKAKITESLILVHNMAAKKQIAINLQIPDNLSVYADGNMLEAIIRNLVSNAIKFSYSGSKITIIAKAASGKRVEISIQDTGIGMNKEIRDNLFHLDVKTNRLGTDGEYSTGLGLILCKDFIDKHGGRLIVQSEEGKGSFFSFTLPSKSDIPKAN